ncbi:hypothetical protein PHYPSEUDO_004553 [Phytophthora pseudosyringae]|uniref:Serine protease n=1 Tax=Phytophthora pseudosyringae TaxID=221518 RepID=A0A8T1WHP3_9STRA|nr:hypothetical protein PHYPSEUDO_004553 [Phytophthora pseudosyringae]
MPLVTQLLSVFSLAAILLDAVSGIEYTDNGVAIVGTTEALNVAVTAGTSREDLISYEFASYIAVHFAGFNLPDGDSVVISSPDDNVTVSHTYTGRGRDQSGTFIASFVPGNSVTVAYTSVGAATAAGQGYRITGFSRGYPTMQQESVCGDGDQSLPAKCYAPGTNLSDELPQAYKKAQSVARLLINGTYLCTGWLGGSEGHLFTNHHCFEQQDWALTTDIEFGAESSSCSDQCETQLGCAGKLVATTSTLIADSEDIDYSVVQLPDCVDLSSYGYLQLRESGPVVNESIYVPQHPDGYAKRIVSTVDDGDNTTIRSVGQDGSCGTEQVGHDADTQGGSSGSPLIASSDNLVVAIHHCGGCTNTAIDVRTVLTDLASKNVTIKNLVASEDADQSSEPLYAQTPCAAQKAKNATQTGRNHTMPSSRNLKTQGSNKTALTTQGSSKTALTTTAPNSTSTLTVTSNVTTPNNLTKSATPAPTTCSSRTASPVATVTASTSASTSSPTPTPSSTTASSTKTTSTSTGTSKSTAALTSASMVTSTTSRKAASASSAAAKASSSVTSSSSTITVANSTSTSTTSKTTPAATTSDCDSSPASTSASTRGTSGTVDNNTIVAKLKAAVVGSTSSPLSTPAATATSHTSTPKPTKPSLPTPSSTPSPTPAATATSTPKPATPSPTRNISPTPTPTTTRSTPAPTVFLTAKPSTASPISTPTTPSTLKPSTANPTPAATVTSTPKPSTPNATPAATATSTPAATPAATATSTPAATPAATATSTPAATPASTTVRPSVTPASTTAVTTTPVPTSTTTSEGGSDDVEQN